jgi:hypothetical protein
MPSNRPLNVIQNRDSGGTRNEIDPTLTAQKKVAPTNNKKQRIANKWTVLGFVAFCYSLEFIPTELE